MSEVTALNSHAVMAREIDDLRKELRNLITIGKKIAPVLPVKERGELVDQMLQAELKLK